MSNGKLDALPQSGVPKTFHEQQADFMDLCGQVRHTLLDSLQRLKERDPKFIHSLAMHMDLINEEVNKELRINFDDRIMHPLLGNKDVHGIEEFHINTLVLLADDLIDTLYVVNSMLNKLGIPATAIYEEVHRSNMAKGVEGKIRRRADGKILKPDGWEPPNIKKIILTELHRLQHREDILEADRIVNKPNTNGD